MEPKTSHPFSPVSTTRVHGPSSWAELTARQLELRCIFWHPSTRPSTRVLKKLPILHGPCTRASGFHYPSWRPEMTGVKNAPELTGRQLGPWTRAVNSGSGNWALVYVVCAWYSSWTVLIVWLAIHSVTVKSCHNSVHLQTYDNNCNNPNQV